MSPVSKQWIRRALFTAFLAAVMSLGAYAFSAVNREFVHADTYAKDRATDSLRAIAQVERSNLRDSILNAKLDEIGEGVKDVAHRVTQIKCGPDISRGCR